jgi:hypothetical protein
VGVLGESCIGAAWACSDEVHCILRCEQGAFPTQMRARCYNGDGMLEMTDMSVLCIGATERTDTGHRMRNRTDIQILSTRRAVLHMYRVL